MPLALRGTTCPRLSFFEATTQVPRRARSTGRLRDHVVDAVIRSGRAVSETAVAFGVSWWMVRAALNEACLLTLPDVDELSRGCWALMNTGSGPSDLP
nr:helix-turn-helix domain-containing protein [Arthrobacter dokdonellae]